MYVYICVNVYMIYTFVNYTSIMLEKKCTAIPWSQSHTLFIIHTACPSWSETLAGLIKGWQIK